MRARIILICFFFLPILLFSQKNFNVGKVYIICDTEGLEEILNQHKSVLIKVSSSPNMFHDEKSIRIYNTYDAIIISSNTKKMIDFFNFKLKSKLQINSNYLISIRHSVKENRNYIDVYEIGNNFGEYQTEEFLVDFCYTTFDPFDSFVDYPRNKLKNNVYNNSPGLIEIRIDSLKLCQIKSSNDSSSTYFIYINELTPRYIEMVKEVNLYFQKIDDNTYSNTIKFEKKDLLSPQTITSKILGFESNLPLKLESFIIVFNYNGYDFSFNYFEPFNIKDNFFDYVESNPDFHLGLKYLPKSTNIWTFYDKDKDNIDDSFDNCNNMKNTYQDDLDKDGIGDECDCNFADPDPIASKDTDGDGVCDNIDKCINEIGQLKNMGCPVWITLKDSIIEPKIISLKGTRVVLPSASYVTPTDRILLTGFIDKARINNDSIIATIYPVDSVFNYLMTQKKENINENRIDSIKNTLSKYRSNFKNSIFNKIDSLYQKLDLLRNKEIQIKTNHTVLNDCIDLIPLYLDSLNQDPNNSVYKALLEEMLESSLQAIESEKDHAFNSPLRNKLLSSIWINKYFNMNYSKGYLLPTVCYVNSDRKKYSKNAKAFYYNGTYGKRHDRKNYFQFGNNPHYELFDVGTFYISYIINDTLPLKTLFELKTVKDQNNYTYMREQTVDASKDKVGWKAIVVLDYLERKRMDRDNPLPGLSLSDELDLIRRLDEINKFQNKYFLVKAKIFYENEK